MFLCQGGCSGLAQPVSGLPFFRKRWLLSCLVPVTPQWRLQKESPYLLVLTCLASQNTPTLLASTWCKQPYSAQMWEELYPALQLSLLGPQPTPKSTKLRVSPSHQRRAWSQSPDVTQTTYSTHKSWPSRPILPSLCDVTKILLPCEGSHEGVLPSENVLGTNIYMMPLSLN